MLIRTKLRADADSGAYATLNARMEQILHESAGFIDACGYAAADGEEIGVIRFESRAALEAWRDHPEHRGAQERGRTEFYAAYRIEVCEVVRAYEYTLEGGRRPALD